MSENDICTRVIDWLDKSWWHLPASEYVLPTIAAFFTPDEPELLTGFPFATAASPLVSFLKPTTPWDTEKAMISQSTG